MITNYIDAKAALNSKKRDAWVDITRRIDKEFEELTAKNYTLEVSNDPFSGDKSNIGKKLSKIRDALSFFIFKGFKKSDKTSVTKWETDNNSKLNTNASAEISSIIKIAEKNKDKNIKVHLLASDTVLSMLSAKLIQEWFQAAKLIEPIYKNIEIIFNDNVKSGHADFIENLRTDLPEDKIFEGFNNLVKKVVDLSKKEETIINITGGYKGFIPILTIIAQIEGLKLNYLYEDSDELIEIGNLPIDFDWAFVEAIGVYLQNDAISELFSYQDEDAKQLQKLLTDYSLVYNDKEKSKYQLSIIGNLLHDYIFNKNKSQIPNTVLGSFIELKYYHLFSENYLRLPYSKPELSHEPKIYYQYKDERLEFSESQKNGYKEIGDIDLLLYKNENQLVLCEIKSERKFVKYSIEKALARVEYMKKTEKIPKEYLFIVWKSKFFKNDKNKFNNDIVQKFNELSEKLDVDVHCYLHELKLQRKSEFKVSYGSLLKEKINAEDFYSINDITIK